MATTKRSLTQAEIADYRKVESAGLALGALGAFQIAQKQHELRMVTKLSYRDLAQELGHSHHGGLMHMKKARDLAVANWGGKAPTNPLDCKLFLAIAYGNLAREVGKNPELANHAKKLGLKVAPKSAGAAKPWTEKLAAAVRSAIAAGADESTIRSALDDAILTAQESGESDESVESGELAAAA